MDEIFLVNSCSFEVLEVSTSIVVAPNTMVDLSQASNISGTFSASYIIAGTNTSASWAPQQQDISVNSITASFISSSNIQTLVPTNPQDVATKDYVDGLNPQGINYYFRSASADVGGYYQMLDANTPFSASQTNLSKATVQTGDYLFEFVSPLMGVTLISAGTIQTRFRSWFTGGGVASLSIVREFYLRSGSTETFLATGVETTLNKTVDASYITAGTLTSSIVINPSTDRLVIKFKASAANQTPTVFLGVEGSSQSGIIIPVPSSNFVLKAGDTMTGNLSATGFTGSLEGTASNAVQSAISTVATSASWASSSLSSSYINEGATFYLVSGSSGIPPAFVEPYDYSIGSYLPPYKEGRMWYDNQYHNLNYYTDDSGFRLQLGKEVVARIHNPYATTLTRASVVYMSGSTVSGLPDVYLAIADGTNTKSNVVGVIRSDITSGSIGYMLLRGQMHRTDLSGYSVGDELWLSTTVPGGLTSTKPGQPNEVVQVGYVTEGGSAGSFLAQFVIEPPPANAYAGMTSIPVISDLTASQEVGIGSGSVNLYSNTYGAGAIVQYPVSEVTFSVPAGYDAYFVYATTNTVTASYQITTDFSIINGTNKVLVTTLYRADEDAHWMESKQEGLALANKLNTRLLETEKFKWESGFSLVSTGSNFYTITEGSIWFGATNISQQEFNSFNTSSTNPLFETHWAYHSASAWIIPIQPDGKWNSGFYDDGTNLVPLTSNSWSVHYIYRILGENPFDEDCFIVTSNYEYDTLASARADALPAGVPAVLDDVAIMVGRLLFQSGSTTATAESAFTTNFGQSTVTQHNSLAGLQGGQGGEYYHLTSADYAGTGTGLIVRQTGASITATGSLDGSASYASRTAFASIAVSSSFADVTLSSSQALFSDSASYATRGLSSSYALRSTNAESSLTANTASFATYASTTNTAVTVSWANNAVSASWAPMPTVSDSSSWASQSLSSSYAIRSSTADSSLTADTASFATYASTFNTVVTVSYADFATSASWAPGGQMGPVESASWASQSLSSSYAVTTNTAITVSYADFATSASWAPGGQVGPVESASWASSSLSSSYAVRASDADSSSYASYATSTNTAITTSWANNAVSASRAISSANADTSSYSSYASTINTAITTSWSDNATSASFASKAATSDTATSASFADTTTSASFAARTITASYSVFAVDANTASFATYAAATNTAITTSWAEKAITASYASSANLAGLVFSKGVTFFDPIGLTGTSSFSQSVVIWRTAIPATASSIWVWKEGGNESLGSASINVRNNGLNLISSSFQVTQSHGWVGVTALTNNNFDVGDTLDVILLTSSFYPQQVAVQINFARH